VIPPNVTASRIWLLRADTEIVSRLDFGHPVDSDPVWSPDSRELVFSSFEVDSQKSDLYRWTVGDPASKLLLSDGRSNKPDHWSSDGKTLVFRRDDRAAFSLVPAADAKPVATGDSDSAKDQLQLSPDGSLLAYNAQRAGGREEVYVCAFPSFRRTIQVSADGGVQPFWSANGNSLYYLARDGSLMSVDIRRGDPIEAGVPKRLFQTPLKGSYWGSQYAVSNDGDKVYLLEPVPSRQDTLHVITNWPAAPAR
jgi:Tol biopolymer transport system component